MKPSGGVYLFRLVDRLINVCGGFFVRCGADGVGGGGGGGRRSGTRRPFVGSLWGFAVHRIQL
jgi:hypothetical protein